jgi:hypothetical protein
MNRRDFLEWLGLAPIASASDAQVVCNIIGHKMEFTHNTPLEKENYVDGKGEGWWWEWFRCKRCGVERRMLVAGPRG